MDCAIFALYSFQTQASLILWLSDRFPTYKVHLFLIMDGAPYEVPLDSINQLSGFGGRFDELHDIIWYTVLRCFS